MGRIPTLSPNLGVFPRFNAPGIFYWNSFSSLNVTYISLHEYLLGDVNNLAKLHEIIQVAEGYKQYSQLKYIPGWFQAIFKLLLL